MSCGLQLSCSTVCTEHLDDLPTAQNVCGISKTTVQFKASKAILRLLPLTSVLSALSDTVAAILDATSHTL